MAKNPPTGDRHRKGAVKGRFQTQNWIEPATNPHHRQFFHSIGFLTMLGYGLKKAYDWKLADKGVQILRFLTLCVGAGYIGHLVLDGLMPRSLSLLGKV